jgi:phytol kinase
MTDFILPILSYSAAFMALFIFAELLHVKAGVDAEYTRKLVHIITGLLTLGFPVYFTSAWQVVIICTLFLVLLTISRQLNLLQSINNVKRQTAGSILFPIIVVIVFLFYNYMKKQESQGYLNFFLPILVMALCDPVAAIVGKRYQSNQNTERKTIEGTISFILLSYVLSFLLLFFFTDRSLASISGWSVLIALSTGITERISMKGWDNFTIPLAAMCVLYLMNYFP